jgi:hypothetical protein
MDKQAQPEEKLQLGSVSSFHPIQSTPEAEDISFVIQPETVEDVLLKSRMREIFMSGSVRGLIVTSGLLPQQKRCAMGSTRRLLR